MQLEDEVAPDSDEFLFSNIKSDNRWEETLVNLYFMSSLNSNIRLASEFFSWFKLRWR